MRSGRSVGEHLGRSKNQKSRWGARDAIPLNVSSRALTKMRARVRPREYVVTLHVEDELHEER